MRCILSSIVLGTCLSCAVAQPEGGARDYPGELRALVAANQSPGANGYDNLRRLAPRLEALEQGLINQECYLEQAWVPVNADHETLQQREQCLESVRAALASARAAGLFDEFATLAAASNLLPPMLGEWTPDEEFDFLRPTRRFARVNTARFVLALEGQDRDDAVAAVRETLWLSRRVAALGSPESLSSGGATDLLVLQAIREQIIRGAVDAETAAAILSVLTDAPPTPRAMFVYDCERLRRRHDFALLFNGKGELIAERLRLLSINQFDRTGLDPNAKGDATLPGLEQLLRWDDEFSKSFPAMASALPRERSNTERRANGNWRMSSASTPQNEVRFDVFDLIYSTAEPIADLACRLTLEDLGTKIMLAIEVYRDRHGRPPTGLADLAPEILPDLPPDPYTGKALHYRPDPDAALGYVLYSAGYDTLDDNARPWRESDQASQSLRVRGMGSDYLFTPATDSD
ncbi:MAG: hypothetical protein HND58_11390 [Planctomycetota bacterium]|nr:MAG: hypothetical protein HND58_11390 [Planctomycetota bacterium]